MKFSFLALLFVVITAGNNSIAQQKGNIVEANGIETNIREFLWENWRDGRPAEISVTDQNLEGEETRTTYKLRPKGKGKSEITIKVRKLVIDPKNPDSPCGGKNFVRQNFEYKAATLERVKVDSDQDARELMAIPESNSPLLAPADTTTPGSYFIRLKDKKGKVVSQI
jgi:hypothetical protein